MLKTESNPLGESGLDNLNKSRRNTRKDDVRQWWRTVNVMSGRTNSQSCFTLEPDDVALSEGELAESLNQYFATVAAHDT